MYILFVKVDNYTTFLYRSTKNAKALTVIATLALACTVQILFSWKYKLVLECMPFYARTLDVPSSFDRNYILLSCMYKVILQRCFVSS